MNWLNRQVKPHVFCAPVLAAILIALMLPGPVGAADIYVPDHYGTIQAAINAAVDGADTVIVRDGTWTGPGNKDLDFNGKAITVRSENGAATCIIDCEGLGRGLIFQSGETAASVVDGFTITNGYASTSGWPGNCGGGIYCLYSSPTITNCTITGNTASIEGGGIYCAYADPTITNCTIRSNSAGIAAGGISCTNYSSPTIANCTISGNSADRFGGGIRCAQSSPAITNCTITGNSAGEEGGGIHCSWSDAAMTNCILWGNTAPSGHEIALGTTSFPSTLTVRYSDVQGGAGEAYVEAGCTLDLDGTCIDQDPLFVVGPLHDYYLSQTAAGQGSDSPCVDAGSDTAANLGLDALTTRTDGVPDAGTVDMGYHAPVPPPKTIYVDDDNTGGPWDGSQANPYQYIQDGLTNANPGDTVIVRDGTYTGALNRDLDFNGKSMTLRSENGAASTIIDCENSGVGFYFNSGETAAAVVDGFTITGGYADEGSGIFCYDSSPTIANCTVSGNTAYNSGAGICCWWYSSPTITNCTISGNTAGYGGGIDCSYDSSPTLTNCTISGNEALNDGGGIWCRNGSSPSVTNCILWGNVAARAHEIALWSTAYPSTLTVRYSDVQGGAGEAYVEGDCTLDLDGTCIDQDPLFVLGPLHDYYLSQIAAGQGADSPCVNTGSDTAANLGLDDRTTRTDEVPDEGIVDMGYHSPIRAPGDVDGNGIVDGLDLTAVLTAWQCVPGDPLWDPAADLDGNGLIDGLDLTAVISNWTTASAAASEPTGTEAVKSGTEPASPSRRGTHRGNVRRDVGNVRRK